MLTQLSIENFRLFKQLQVNDLAPVNLIVGKNNAGKTTLLEAFYLLVSSEPHRVMRDLLISRGEYLSFMEDRPQRLPSQLQYDFAHLFYGHQLDASQVACLEGKGEKFYQLQITYLPESDTSDTVNGSGDKPPRLHFGQKDNGQWGELKNVDGYLRRYQDYRFIQDNILYISTNQFDYPHLASLWDKLITSSKTKKQNVIEMLRILEPNVDDLLFLSRPFANSGIVLSLKGEDKPIPLGSMGDGMSRILAIALALANAENGFLFVDEIDTGLHYRTITDMWTLVLTTAVRLNIQIFATTHSLDCIRSFGEALTTNHSNPEIANAGRLIRLQRRGELIEAVGYNSQEISFAVTQEIEVR